ncbi:phosphoribosylaminoimidazolesuccinocarboxamide synthase [Candidatus Micrarchaeota archaeon CG_4_10_14_0_2_um_filter_49_7]|nr:MAG: phosphoribosylaminoimidazolesuccinocarboxamide synthase [Candidatus Micrarchaeota archaeon CG_4_10_14_0_2_um_filter_49_7]
MGSAEAITKTELPLQLLNRGKVCDNYLLDGNILMVATDRLSAFDVVFSEGIPWKGTVLTQLSLFWFDFTKGIIPNHILLPNAPPELLSKFPYLNHRGVLVKRTRVLPIEVVVRGYLAGSGWKDYQATGKVCGIDLPSGLQKGSKLPEPILTPATKEEQGQHDINITNGQAGEIVLKATGEDLFGKLHGAAIKIYKKASDYALSRGIIIADTKFEFGMLDGQLLVIDEMMTPDSSRFWPVDGYTPGREQASFDKQFARDYLETLNWDKRPPAPSLPPDIIEGTSQRYIEAYEKITGKKFNF